jgi:phosphate/sulfate permease
MNHVIVAMPLIVALVALALAFDFINGLHDAANSIATVVSTKLLSRCRRCCLPRSSTLPPIGSSG